MSGPAAAWVRRNRIQFTLHCDKDSLVTDQAKRILKAWDLSYKEEEAEELTLFVHEPATKRMKILAGIEEIEQFFKHLVARYEALNRAELAAAKYE